MIETINWPANTPEQLNAFYGRLQLGEDGLPTDSWRGTFLTQIYCPFGLRLPWLRDRSFRRMTCHREVAPSLQRILGDILNHFGSGEAITKADYDLFAGCYMYRPACGSHKLSMHAYGAAILLGPLRAPKRVETEHDKAVNAIFENEGWRWLGMSEGWGAIGE